MGLEDAYERAGEIWATLANLELVAKGRSPLRERGPVAGTRFDPRDVLDGRRDAAFKLMVEAAAHGRDAERAATLFRRLLDLTLAQPRLPGSPALGGQVLLDRTAAAFASRLARDEEELGIPRPGGR